MTVRVFGKSRFSLDTAPAGGGGGPTGPGVDPKLVANATFSGYGETHQWSGDGAGGGGGETPNLAPVGTEIYGIQNRVSGQVSQVWQSNYLATGYLTAAEDTFRCYTMDAVTDYTAGGKTPANYWGAAEAQSFHGFWVGKHATINALSTAPASERHFLLGHSNATPTSVGMALGLHDNGGTPEAFLFVRDSGGTPVEAEVATGFSVGEWHLIEYWYDHTTNELGIRVDNNAAATTTYDPASGLRFWTSNAMGTGKTATSGAGWNANGFVAALSTFDVKLAESDVTDVRNWYGTTYSLTV